MAIRALPVSDIHRFEGKDGDVPIWLYGWLVGRGDGHYPGLEPVTVFRTSVNMWNKLNELEGHVHVQGSRYVYDFVQGGDHLLILPAERIPKMIATRIDRAMTSSRWLSTGPKRGR